MAQIPVTKIMRNPQQPRTVFDKDSLAELAQSIKETGLIQPIVVEDNGDGTYTLVGGERRWRAHQLLGRETIEANIRERSNHNGRELLVMGLVENVQRDDMNAMDEGEAYQRLHDEHGMDWADIGKQVGKSTSALQQRALLTKLDPEIKEMIRRGEFTGMSSVARALLAIPDGKSRVELARQARAGKFTWRQVIGAAERMARAIAEQQKEKDKPADKRNSPAMRQALKKSRRDDFDEETPPSGWDALKQAGTVPEWSKVSGASQAVCKSCSLSSMANDVTCNECPLVEFIVRVVRP
jgi:ParB family chromosome partitioning protein